MIKISYVELVEATFRHQISKCASRVTTLNVIIFAIVPNTFAKLGG